MSYEEQPDSCLELHEERCYTAHLNAVRNINPIDEQGKEWLVCQMLLDYQRNLITKEMHRILCAMYAERTASSDFFGELFPDIDSEDSSSE